MQRVRTELRRVPRCVSHAAVSVDAEQTRDIQSTPSCCLHTDHKRKDPRLLVSVQTTGGFRPPPPRLEGGGPTVKPFSSLYRPQTYSELPLPISVQTTDIQQNPFLFLSRPQTEKNPPCLCTDHTHTQTHTYTYININIYIYIYI